MGWAADMNRRAAINRVQVAKKAKWWGIAVEGGHAFRYGKSPTQCPYVLSTHEWDIWIFGWRSAFDRRQEMI